jgi:uncharacterized protein YbjT (DUF2867 family)
MRILVTGVTGYVGAALVPRLKHDGHEVVGFARDATRVSAPVDDVIEGDAITGTGFDRALDGVDVAYYLIHSMQKSSNGGFEEAELRSATNFARAAAEAGTKRVVYLGGLVPQDAPLSRHLRSRLQVEEALLDAVPSSIAFRASIVIAARSRSFRFLVRLIERLPVLALPGWRVHRTQPVDGRDVLEFLTAAATAHDRHAGSWDIAGPDVMSYQQMMERIADAMLIDRPKIGLGFSLTQIAAPVAAAVASEDPGLIGPLMESLEHDLLPRDERAPEAFGVRLHDFDSAVERSLRDLEITEGVRAR